jgi:hypothetical protein
VEFAAFHLEEEEESCSYDYLLIVDEVSRVK